MYLFPRKITFPSDEFGRDKNVANREHVDQLRNFNRVYSILIMPIANE